MHQFRRALLRAGADINALDHLGISAGARFTCLLGRRALDPRLLRNANARLPAPDDPTLRASASNVTTYIEAVRQAGSIAVRNRRRAPFVAVAHALRRLSRLQRCRRRLLGIPSMWTRMTGHG